MAYSFADYVVDKMKGLENIQQRPLFGGVGLFCAGEMFAIATNHQLYLRADSETRELFDRRGLERFTYTQSGIRYELDYYRAPAEVYISPAEMRVWAEQAMMVAYRSHSRVAA